MKIIIFTDLDGTLLDAVNYSYEPAGEALETISELQIPLVIMSSKTKEEIELLRRDLRNNHPFVSENGGGVFIPEAYFPFPVHYTRKEKDCLIVESGIRITKLTEFLDRVTREHAFPVKAFHSMSLKDVSRLTGLPMDLAAMAKAREYDEPFLFEGNEDQWARLKELVESEGLVLTRGGRFSHISGSNDKGTAVRILMDCYRRQYTDTLIVGLGDALNDLPFLRMVDIPVLIQRPDGTYDSEIDIPGLYYASRPGPEGWNSAVLEIIRRGRIL